jgi:hypothetical protein
MLRKAEVSGDLPAHTKAVLEDRRRIQKRNRDADARRLAGQDDRQTKIGHSTTNSRRK